MTDIVKSTDPEQFITFCPKFSESKFYEKLNQPDVLLNWIKLFAGSKSIQIRYKPQLAKLFTKSKFIKRLYQIIGDNLNIKIVSCADCRCTQHNEWDESYFVLLAHLNNNMESSYNGCNCYYYNFSNCNYRSGIFTLGEFIMKMGSPSLIYSLVKEQFVIDHVHIRLLLGNRYQSMPKELCELIVEKNIHWITRIPKNVTYSNLTICNLVLRSPYYPLYIHLFSDQTLQESDFTHNIIDPYELDEILSNGSEINKLELLIKNYGWICIKGNTIPSKLKTICETGDINDIKHLLPIMDKLYCTYNYDYSDYNHEQYYSFCDVCRINSNQNIICLAKEIYKYSSPALILEILKYGYRFNPNDLKYLSNLIIFKSQSITNLLLSENWKLIDQVPDHYKTLELYQIVYGQLTHDPTSSTPEFNVIPPTILTKIKSKYGRKTKPATHINK
jgi:hypothetical protein